MVRVAVGLSGGVDSAVSALLLKQGRLPAGRQGFDVVGVHLYCYPAKSEVEKDGITRREWIKKNGCRADEDRQAALKTALELDIPFKVLDFSEEYNRRVVDYFYREYEAGRTPNPDVLCNSEIKFGLFLDWALANGFDYVATGHYAKLVLDSHDRLVRPRTAGSRLLSGRGFAAGGHPTIASSLFIPKDKHKDQTYFLWKLTQRELAHVLFPLADLTKAEVRKMAKKAGLSVADRPDSQGICFIGNVDVKKFLSRRLMEKPGEVVDLHGEVVGQHRGIWFYTIGERGGWRLSAKAQKKYAVEGKTPTFFVTAKDAKKNELVVGIGRETLRQSFEVGEMNWIGQVGQIGPIRVRIRHGGKLIRAEITPSPRSSEVSPSTLEGECKVELSEAQRGVAPGQSAVFYLPAGRQVRSIECLGGGVIV